LLPLSFFSFGRAQGRRIHRELDGRSFSSTYIIHTNDFEYFFTLSMPYGLEVRRVRSWRLFRNASPEPHIEAWSSLLASSDPSITEACSD
jgi:hypothetical protein